MLFVSFIGKVLEGIGERKERRRCRSCVVRRGVCGAFGLVGEVIGWNAVVAVSWALRDIGCTIFPACGI